MLPQQSQERGIPGWAKGHSDGEADLTQHQRLSPGTGELALPLKGGGTQGQSLKIPEPHVSYL